MAVIDGLNTRCCSDRSERHSVHVGPAVLFAMLTAWAEINDPFRCRKRQPSRAVTIIVDNRIGLPLCHGA